MEQKCFNCTYNVGGKPCESMNSYITCDGISNQCATFTIDGMVKKRCIQLQFKNVCNMDDFFPGCKVSEIEFIFLHLHIFFYKNTGHKVSEA